jgi:hypothetical protein
MNLPAAMKAASLAPIFSVTYSLKLTGTNQKQRCLMAGAVDDVNGVRKQTCDRIQRLDGAARAAWKIEDNRFRPNAGNPAREQRTLREFLSLSAHMLGKSGYQPFDCCMRGLGRDVARAYACATGRQDQIDRAITGVGRFLQERFNRDGFVRENRNGYDLPAELLAAGSDGGPGTIFVFPGGNGIADCHN